MSRHAPEPIRYAIYTRQSVEKLAGFSSCEAQFQTYRDFVHSLGDRSLTWCGQRFDDEEQSGATLERVARSMRDAIAKLPNAYMKNRN